MYIHLVYTYFLSCQQKPVDSFLTHGYIWIYIDAWYPLRYDMCMNIIRYNVIFRPEPEGGFTATVPALPGCVTYGKTLKDAKEIAIDAIKAYLVSLKKHNEPIPTDNESFITSIDLPQISSQRPVSYV